MLRVLNSVENTLSTTVQTRLHMINVSPVIIFCWQCNHFSWALLWPDQVAVSLNHRATRRPKHLGFFCMDSWNCCKGLTHLLWKSYFITFSFVLNPTVHLWWCLALWILKMGNTNWVNKAVWLTVRDGENNAVVPNQKKIKMLQIESSETNCSNCMWLDCVVP